MIGRGTQNKILALVVGVVLLFADHGYAQYSPSTATTIGTFPRLPPSERCEKWKVLGTWKLLMVYESPAGIELERYAVNPLQYYIFTGDDIYGEYVGGLSDLAIDEIHDYAINRSKFTQQYVVSKDGIIFFYRNSIPIDSLACFIVVEPVKPFMFGQMLLMPPKNAAIRGRMVKIYQKVFP